MQKRALTSRLAALSALFLALTINSIAGAQEFKVLALRYTHGQKPTIIQGTYYIESISEFFDDIPKYYNISSEKINYIEFIDFFSEVV